MNPIKVFHNNSDGSAPSKTVVFLQLHFIVSGNTLSPFGCSLVCEITQTWCQKRKPNCHRFPFTAHARRGVRASWRSRKQRATEPLGGILGEVELCHFAGLERPIRIGGVSSATAWLAGVRCALIKAAQEAICVNSGRRAEVKRQQTRSAKRVKVAAEWEEPDIREVTVLKEPLCRWFIHASTWVGICSEVQK